MIERGKSYSDTAETVNKIYFTARRVIQRFFGKENVMNAPWSGRWKRLNNGEREEINIIKKDAKTSWKLTARLKDKCGTEMHPLTTQRILKSAGYDSRVIKRGPLMFEITRDK